MLPVLQRLRGCNIENNRSANLVIRRSLIALKLASKNV